MQELISLVQRLVAFKSTADNPEEIQKGFQYIASLFDAHKFETKLLERNGKYSLLVSFKGKDALRPKVLLNGHFDVVPAETEQDYHVRVEGDRAFGRGTADMKGMAAVLILVMQELVLRQAQGKAENFPNVALLLNGDEEVGGEDGAGYVARELGVRPEFLLCGDATHENREIVIKEKGGAWVEIKAKGKSAHAAYLWKGENAIDKLTVAIEKIKEFVGPMEPEAWKSTCNVGLIEASNKTPNKVPGDAGAVLDIRFTEDLAKTPEELLKKVEVLVPEVEVSLLTNIPLMVMDEHNSFLQAFQQTAEKVLGTSVPLGFSHGATDARYFAELGVPALIFGGQGANFHGPGEWISLESLEQNKQILLSFLASINSQV